ncbi:MAG: enoyl-CoA hydratase [Flavobacteriaceae bacterium]|nr:MAG: enoyl-CoA hydratase [Flavobacteriaceae bacterium]
MSFENLNIEIENQLAVLTINRPSALNALNSLTMQELSHGLDMLIGDSKVKVIVITGAGDKAFVAGADIKEFLDLDIEKARILGETGHKNVFDKIENSPKPVIAAIGGFALGGGLELALACHIRLASENAKMGLPEVTLGLIPGYGGTQRLANIIGKGRAMQAIFTAEFYSAQRAYEMGLVNQVVSGDLLLETAKKMAEKIIGNSSTAIAKAIEAINLCNQPEKGFKKEIEGFASLFDTHDFKEGTLAFVEKRKPNFT